jgi:hypothetical protein
MASTRSKTSVPAAGRVILDPDGTLPASARELRLLLSRLAEERLCARDVGLDRDRAYMADLELEVAEASCAYAGAAVLQLAALRAALSGRLLG